VCECVTRRLTASFGGLADGGGQPQEMSPEKVVTAMTVADLTRKLLKRVPECFTATEEGQNGDESRFS